MQETKQVTKKIAAPDDRVIELARELFIRRATSVQFGMRDPATNSNEAFKAAEAFYADARTRPAAT